MTTQEVLKALSTTRTARKDIEHMPGTVAWLTEKQANWLLAVSRGQRHERSHRVGVATHRTEWVGDGWTLTLAMASYPTPNRLWIKQCDEVS